MEEKVNYYTGSGIACLIGGALVLGFTGSCINVVAALIPELLAAGTLSPELIGPVMATSTAAGALCALIGTKAIDLLTPKWCLFIGSIVSGIYLLCFGLSDAYSVYVVGAAFAGVGIGIGSMPACAGLAGQFFGEHSGKIYSFMLGAMYLLGAVFTAVTGAMTKTMDYRTICLVMAGVIGVGGAALNLLLIHKPSKAVQDAVARLEGAVGDAASPGSDSENTAGFSIKQVMKSPALWLMIVGMFMGAYLNAVFNSYGSVIFTDFGMSTENAAYWIAFWDLFMGIQSLWVGAFEEKFGPKALVVTVFGSIIIGIGFLCGWAFLQTAMLLVIGLILLAMIKPINAIPACTIPALFGRKDYTAINSFQLGFYYAGTVFSQLVSGVILGSLGGQVLIYVLFVPPIVALVCMMLSFGFSPMKNWRH